MGQPLPLNRPWVFSRLEPLVYGILDYMMLHDTSKSHAHSSGCWFQSFMANLHCSNQPQPRLATEHLKCSGARAPADEPEAVARDGSSHQKINKGTWSIWPDSKLNPSPRKNLVTSAGQGISYTKNSVADSTVRIYLRNVMILEAPMHILLAMGLFRIVPPTCFAAFSFHGRTHTEIAAAWNFICLASAK